MVAHQPPEQVTTLQAIRQWLGAAPIEDPVDRRNATMVQVVLFLLAVVSIPAWFYRAGSLSLPWQPAELQGFVASLLICVAALASVYLIRRGRFRWAVRQFLVVIALGILWGAWRQGLDAGRYWQPVVAVWLVLAGLVLGRRALWLLFAATAASIALGAAVDVGRGGGSWLGHSVDGLICCLVFALIAVVVDRAGAALRAGLLASARRADELDWTNNRLEQEMAEREQAREEVVELQRKEAVARLSLGVSHDFKHLLTLIAGYAEQGKSAATNEAVHKAFDDVMGVTQRASVLAEKLLHFGRHEPAEASVFDVGEVLGGMQSIVQLAFGSRSEVDLALCDAACPVLLNRSAFELMVLNMADNANRAMPRGGRFTVRTEVLDDELHLSFADTGVGMDAATRERLFRPFFTTRPGEDGLGLGLSVAHDFVREAGGVIDVRSRLGEGTCFTVRLPMCPSNAK